MSSRLLRFLASLASLSHAPRTAQQLAASEQYARPALRGDRKASPDRDGSSRRSKEAVRALEAARRVCEGSAPPGA
jgi:hypothetical protein